MTLYWLGSLVMLFGVTPVVFVLLRNVLAEARGIVPSIDRIASVATAASKDLDAAPLLLTTQQQAIMTVETVADLGGSLDVILDDAR